MPADLPLAAVVLITVLLVGLLLGLGGLAGPRGSNPDRE